MKRTVFRKWHDETGNLHIVAIFPTGQMREIEFEYDGCVNNVTISQTLPAAPLASDAFVKNKEVATALEWQKAVETATNFARGTSYYNTHDLLHYK